MSIVVAVSCSASHTMTKPNVESIRLLAGLGVEGDAHCGELVKHRSRVQRDPTQPNLRQVHLVHAELLDELVAAGFDVAPGRIGENVTTRGLDLLGLPVGARLALGADAVVEVTGLRNPCGQLDGIQPGLRSATIERDGEEIVRRLAGIMGVVVTGGDVRPGDRIAVSLPDGPHRPLEVV
jgi:MOSC domain-containing protein YiiM